MAPESGESTNTDRSARISTLRLYGLHLDRVRLRAIATRQRRDGEQLEHTEAELARVESTLADLRARPDDGARDRHIAGALALSTEEVDLLWAALAASMDPALGPHLRDLGGAETRHGISLALHAVIARLDEEAARTLTLVLGAVHPLLRYGLLEASNEGVPMSRALSVPWRVARFLAGDDTIDDAVLRAGGLLGIEQAPHFDEAQLACVEQLAQALASEPPVLALVEGPLHVGKRTAAAVAALSCGQQLIQIDLTRISPTLAELERSFVALRRECLLNGALPLVAHVDDLISRDGGANERMRGLARLLDETPIPVVLTSCAPELALETERGVLRLAMPVPDVVTRKRLWQRTVGDGAGVDLDLLSLRYRLGAGGIRKAVAAARLLSNEAPTTHALVQGVRNGIAERLGELAHRVEVKQSWDDLILSPDTFDQIKGLVGRVRHGHVVFEQWGFSDKLPRGRGTAALFSGPPGTGKTMVAGIIAAELDLELYQVDLSRVVSKWVGETEKQLAKIFDAAEAGHALLLFDEADSLFAKRTEVKSANDRYANLEVNYLLQRIESFGGISILTTNLDTSIDPALRRRLAAHVVFYPPDADEQMMLWERLLPPEAPRRELDFEAVVDQFPDMTGANIRNAVLAAAFLAASEGSPIAQDHLERAARGEYRAMGRVVR